MIDSYSTVVFDVGGTLLHFDLDALARAYIETAAMDDVALDAAATRAMVAELERELPTRQKTRVVSLERDNGQEFWETFYTDGFRRLGVMRDVSAAAAIIRARFQRAEFETMFADVLPTLDALAARGARLGILSNFSANLENVLRQVGVHHYFAFFVVSALAGVEKPDARIFDLAVRAAQCPRARMVYVGDSIFHDIDGARNAGLAAVLVDRENQHADFSGARVRDLRELVK